MQDGDMGIRMESGVATAAEAQAEIAAAYANGIDAACATVRSGMTKEEIDAVGKGEATLADGDCGGGHMGIVFQSVIVGASKASKTSAPGVHKKHDEKPEEEHRRK
jgi:hypothetical protein